MIYIMADIHGRYDLYKAMLEKIEFNRKDTIYVLGDVVDRGDDGIRILRDMMKRINVIPIIGNHEYMAYSVLKKLNVEITEKNYEDYLDIETIGSFQEWMLNGGLPTCRSFSKLNAEEKDEILEYIGEFELYEELQVNGKSFVLVHGGLKKFRPEKPLEEYSVSDIVWSRCDYSKQYYPDRYLVTGHTPTHFIDSAYEGRIYRKNRHIAIDCGAVSVGCLGCICLDTMEEFYVTEACS